MEALWIVFQAIVAFCAFGGFALGIRNTWQARRLNPTIFECEMIPEKDFWTVEWTIRNVASIPVQIEGISDVSTPFAIEKDVPIIDDPEVALGRRDPRNASFRSGRREIRISVPPSGGSDKSLKTYFDNDPDNREMVFHWRWSREARPRTSRIQIRRTN